MAVLLGILLALLALVGIGEPSVSSTSVPAAPSASTGSIRVIARSCPSGVTSARASADACAIWPDGAAIQATDLNGNAWGMNASRDASLPGNPVVYSLDGLAFGTYNLGAPALPAGFTSFIISGAQSTAGGNPHVELSAAHPHTELVVYFLKGA